MYYEFEITVPITATEDDPIEMSCLLSYGILAKISLSFPAGVHRVTKIKIFHGIHQLFPTNLEEGLTSDDFSIVFSEYYPVLEKPYELKVFGWNNGGSYPHTIRLGFSILLPQTVGQESYKPTNVEELQQLLGEYENVKVS